MDRPNPLTEARRRAFELALALVVTVAGFSQAFLPTTYPQVVGALDPWLHHTFGAVTLAGAVLWAASILRASWAMERAALVVLVGAWSGLVVAELHYDADGRTLEAVAWQTLLLTAAALRISWLTRHLSRLRAER